MSSLAWPCIDMKRKWNRLGALINMFTVCHTEFHTLLLLIGLLRSYTPPCLNGNCDYIDKERFHTATISDQVNQYVHIFQYNS